jgi:hypothetical protein
MAWLMNRIMHWHTTSPAGPLTTAASAMPSSDDDLSVQVAASMATAPPAAAAQSGVDAPTLAYRPAVLAAWRLWHRHVGAFVPVAIVVVAPLVLIGELLNGLLDGHEVGAIAVSTLFGIGAAALAEALSAGISEELLRTGSEHPGRRPTVREAARRVSLWRLTILAIVVGVAVGAGSAIGVLPGLALFAWLAIACTSAMVERHGVIDSLRASVRLVRGRYWSVAALTTTAAVVLGVAEGIGVGLHAIHPPLWATIVVEVVVETVAISLTAAIILVVFWALMAGPRGHQPSDAPPIDTVGNRG